MIVDDFTAIASAMKSHNAPDDELAVAIVAVAKPNEGKYVAAFDELRDEWAARRRTNGRVNELYWELCP